MATIDTVVPNCLNYTDIKPQSIEAQIDLVKFQPTASVTGIRQGEMVKFLITGNALLDPYSTFFQFKVKCEDLKENEVRFLDRSAHSFIDRIVIRSQGVEIERIEQYDIISAMINDMIYSPEQCTLHYWEGFPTHQYQPPMNGKLDYEIHGGGAPADGGQIEGTKGLQQRDLLTRFLNQGSTPTEYSYVGEVAFTDGLASSVATASVAVVAKTIDCVNYIDATRKAELGVGADDTYLALQNQEAAATRYPFTYSGHLNGRRTIQQKQSVVVADANVSKILGTNEYLFQIPIYSGLIGLLMPEKKLLPISLLPLDIEITFNPHALYSNLAGGSRNYTITEFLMYGNFITFEQEIHKTLEAANSDHGMFIYCNGFHSAPIQTIPNNTIPQVSHIAMNLKSINSVHMVFLYQHYWVKPYARKLHFVSHNLQSLQLTNGTVQIPRYAISGHSGTSTNGSHLPFIMELYKAWNKMHDPTTDGSLHAYNFCGDEYAGQFDPLKIELTTNDTVLDSLLRICNKQSLVGRCQYGITLEGEELGTDRTMITGRKSQYPFFIELRSEGKSNAYKSLMHTFLRADYIVYIRPDMQIVTLGK